LQHHQEHQAEGKQWDNTAQQTAIRVRAVDDAGRLDDGWVIWLHRAFRDGFSLWVTQQ
jgi:hypothetical protein